MTFTSRSVIDRTISFTSNKFDKYNKKYSSSQLVLYWYKTLHFPPKPGTLGKQFGPR